MDTKRWIIFSVAVVAILGGLVWMAQKNKIDVSSIDNSAIVGANDMNGGIGDHVLGNKNSKVVWIEYGDFQCPGCAAAHPYVNELVEEYGDKIAFVYRHLPLTSIHPNARTAAAASEAAGKQGKFWEMYNLIFDSQEEWQGLSSSERTDAFAKYAKEVGVANIDTFKEDMASESVSRKISFNQALAKKVGATGTPSFSLGSTLVDKEATNNITSGDTVKMREALDAALKKHNITPPSHDNEAK